ncbi:CDGSH iron sulfur domain-containing protein 3 [Strigomonas culicis]|nr:CDGSH iron sulfur domain-containing protein 3 [Strigomonas culicis]|eukprot:EPY35924.1 CDGSH iron sulfur domain-containing protein 3 [Strigomonas culicis]
MFRSKVFLQFWKTKRDPSKVVQVPNKTPAFANVEKGKKYYWCSCGLSTNQPFCDGKHKSYNETHSTALKPIEYTATETKKVLFCRCKSTGNAPLCDLSHVGVLFRSAVGIEKQL